MPLFSEAEYVGPLPSSNYSTEGTPKIGGVVHVVVGSASSALSEFKRSGEELSAHFIVCGPGDEWPDGHILQPLDTSLVAYAQEAGNWPPIAYYAIEFSGQPTTAMSEAQLASGAAIVAWGAKTHDHPLVGPVEHGEPGVTTHCHPNGQADPAWGNHSCPGTIRLAQVPEMIAMAVAINNPPVPKPTPAPIPETQEEPMFVASIQGQTEDFVVWSNGTKTGIPTPGALFALLQACKQEAAIVFPEGDSFIANLPTTA